MRIMALDIGEVRTGVAISDATQKIATPLCILNTLDVVNNAKPFRQTLDDWEPEALIVGLPKSLDGKENAQAQKIRDVAQKIEMHTSVPIKYVDERLSSSEAKTYMREMGLTEHEMRGKVDALAACIFLQSYLDSR